MGANGCEYEIETIYSRYIDYIYAEGKIVALHVHNTTANADSIYYVQTDLLGSRERIVDGNRYVVQSCLFDPWGNRMSASDWTLAQDGRNFAFRRGFTRHENYDRFGIINMNARLYDPVLGRFFSPDPQVQSPFSTQGFNRYSYCGNNPVMYVDEDGELAWFIPLIAAAVGGVVNVAVNAVNGNLSGYDFWTTVGKGAAAFFAGAAQGASACFGPGWMAAGGALAGGVNSWLGGGDVLAGAVTGSIASTFGGMAGQWATRGVNVMINGFNITSPVLRGVLAGGTAGAAAGFASGFVTSGISSGWVLPAMFNGGLTGALSGGILGGIAGGTSAYAYATSHNINPWTGRPNSRIIVIGRDMGGRVNPVANVIEAETISSDWNSATNDNYRGNILEGKQFNRDWIQLKKEQRYAIFDIGEGSFPVGYNYGMELRYLQGYPSVYPTHIVVLYRRISIIYYNGPTTY